MSNSAIWWQIKGCVAINMYEKHICCSERLLCGHEYESDGRYRSFYFPDSIEWMAKFLDKSVKPKLICDADDYGIFAYNGVDTYISNLEDSEYAKLKEKLGMYKDCCFEQELINIQR